MHVYIDTMIDSFIYYFVPKLIYIGTYWYNLRFLENLRHIRMEQQQEEGNNIIILAPGQTGLGCEICVVCGDRASGRN